MVWRLLQSSSWIGSTCLVAHYATLVWHCSKCRSKYAINSIYKSCQSQNNWFKCDGLGKHHKNTYSFWWTLFPLWQACPEQRQFCDPERILDQMECSFCGRERQEWRAVGSVCERVRKDQSKKRKAPEEKTKGEVCATGCWCGLFVVAVCLCLEKSSRTRKELNCNK